MQSKGKHLRCRICGGFGLGLVRNVEKICTHCARETKAFFDPEKCKFCSEQGFYDISPDADGKILKKIVREGDRSAKWIEEGCPTFVQYIGRLMDGSIFDTTRDVVDGKHVGGTDDEFEFQIGRGKVIKGWDIGVISMKLGEIARFIIKPEYAYGSQGCAPKIEPDETLDFEIELVRFGDPLPRFPTPAELAETRKQQHEENKKMLEENPPPTVDERVRLATEEKQKGNSCIAEKDYEAAQKHYDSGFVNIFYAKDEWDQLLSEQDRAEINQIKLLLYLNRGLCKLKLNKIEDALWDCDQAISLDATASKAHFRRGLVYTEKLKQEFEKERNGQFWVIDKGVKYAKEAQESFRKASELCSNADAGIARGMLELERQKAQLQRYASKYKEDEKRLYKEQIFDRMVAKNKKLQEQEAKRAMEDVFKDMPALE